MSVNGFIESFSGGDVGIVVASQNSEVSIKLNRDDFPTFLQDIIDKAKRLGLYKCKCNGNCQHKDKPVNEAPSCPTRKSLVKPIDGPNPKTHGNADETAECKS